jgi:hypothetical protein
MEEDRFVSNLDLVIGGVLPKLIQAVSTPEAQ